MYLAQGHVWIRSMEAVCGSEFPQTSVQWSVPRGEVGVEKYTDALAVEAPRIDWNVAQSLVHRRSKHCRTRWRNSWLSAGAPSPNTLRLEAMRNCLVGNKPWKHTLARQLKTGKRLGGRLIATCHGPKPVAILRQHLGCSSMALSASQTAVKPVATRWWTVPWKRLIQIGKATGIGDALRGSVNSAFLFWLSSSLSVCKCCPHSYSRCCSCTAPTNGSKSWPLRTWVPFKKMCWNIMMRTLVHVSTFAVPLLGFDSTQPSRLLHMPSLFGRHGRTWACSRKTLLRICLAVWLCGSRRNKHRKVLCVPTQQRIRRHDLDFAEEDGPGARCLSLSRSCHWTSATQWRCRDLCSFARRLECQEPNIETRETRLSSLTIHHSTCFRMMAVSNDLRWLNLVHDLLSKVGVTFRDPNSSNESTVAERQLCTQMVPVLGQQLPNTLVFHVSKCRIKCDNIAKTFGIRTLEICLEKQVRNV